MKKIYIYAMLVMSMFLFMACPSDDDDLDNSKLLLDNPLIGCWYISNDNVLFMSDGIMYYNNGTKRGTWSYNKESTILSASVNNWQWQVGAIDSLSWTGLQLFGKNPRSWTYERSKAYDIAKALIVCRKWKDVNGNELNFRFDGGWIISSIDKKAIFGNFYAKEYIKDNIFVLDGRSPGTKNIVGTKAVAYIYDPYNYYNSRLEIRYDSGQKFSYYAE